MNPRVIQVIETDTLYGRGTVDDPFRRVRQYFTLDGTLLGEELQQPSEPIGNGRRDD